MNEKPEKPGKPSGQEEAIRATEASGALERAPPPTLSPTRVAHVEQGLRAFQETEAEMASLRNNLNQAHIDIKERDLEIISLKMRVETLREDHAGFQNVSDSRTMSLQAERDRAVSEATALKAFIASMKAVWDRIPNGSKEG
jgi:hypothetical protein